MDVTLGFVLTVSQLKAEEVVEAISQEIKTALRHGDSVIFRRFGSFQVRDKGARIGRNPKTGQEADIPAHRWVRFKSGRPFKDAVNGSPADGYHRAMPK
jgi:nucleoid DNA-binding protein